MSMTDSERVLNRARALMLNKGYGWSKAIDLAAQTVENDRTRQWMELAQKAQNGSRAAAQAMTELLPRLLED